MKLPNGYGSVYKLSGRRRKPYGARITVGWKEDPISGTIKQQYKVIGYYETRAAALQGLAKYHENPYDLDNAITFAELYQKWSEEKFPTVSHSNVNAYRAAFAVCSPLYSMKFAEIRRNHLQNVIDTCGKNYPTLRKVKVLFSQLYTYALQNDVCEKDYGQYVDIAKHKEKNKQEIHKPFSSKEIKTLWENVERNRYVQIILMLIYSGVRVSELLELKKKDVHINKRYFNVVQSKTEAGVRKVPIADKTLPFFIDWLLHSKGEYLLETVEGKPMKYFIFRETYWNPLMKELGMEHLAHDTRHTTISMLTKAEVTPTIIKRIVGHSGAMNLTERVYTHFEIQQLTNAINKI